jgi:hypothetical protein
MSVVHDPVMSSGGSKPTRPTELRRAWRLGPMSDLRQNPRFEFSEFELVAFVERPLLDALRLDEPRLREDLKMFAHGGMADAEFLRDMHSAYAILHKITVNLGREMLKGRAQPVEDLQAAWV